MALYSYVVARDFGFAPNPFFGVCTLATCKPQIRRRAAPGDWIVGIAPKKFDNRLVYFMKVDECLTFDDYWHHPQFSCKRPNLRGSLMRAFGDNIYHSDGAGGWIQENSHHTLPNGQPNPNNLIVDTSAPVALIARRFGYWGSEPVELPKRFRQDSGESLLVAIGHRSKYSQAFIDDLTGWIEDQNIQGYQHEPRDWRKTHRTG